MNLQGHLIKTPTDFRPTLQAEVSSWDMTFTLNPDYEPKVRQRLDAIFQDLPYIGQDPDVQSAYLTGIAEPLRDLREWGLALFALMYPVVYRMEEGDDLDMVRVDYLVIPQGSYFHVPERENAAVHHYDPHCGNALEALLEAIREKKPLQSWARRKELEQDMERNVPWCTDCAAEEMFT